jgi:hypothetical protein
MRGIRLEDRIFIAGMTGKGKTTFARWLAEQLQPIRQIVFDPKDELDFGVEKARTPAELATAMHQPIVHYVPSGFDRDQLEEACQIVWETPGPYLWWVDELSEVSNPSYCPPGLRLAVTQGRQKKKMVMGLCQRLAETHPVFRSQAEHIIVFVPAPIDLDLKELAKATGIEASVLGAELASLHAEHGDFSHVWFVRPSQELRRCAPLDTGGSPGAPVTAPEPTGGDGPAATAAEEPEPLCAP